MPYLTKPITDRGASVDVLVGLDEKAIKVQQLAHKPIPQAVRLEALVDTGAGISCIDNEVLQHLRLSPMGSMWVAVPGGTPLLCDLFKVTLTILHPSDVQKNSILVASVASANVRATGVDALIGCDLLEKCEFFFNGRPRTFTLDY